MILRWLRSYRENRSARATIADLMHPIQLDSTKTLQQLVESLYFAAYWRGAAAQSRLRSSGHDKS